MRFIYIVDDDRVSRAVIHGLAAQQTNAIVHTFASGIEFLDAAEKLDPGALVLDLHMPNLDGTKVLERLSGQETRKFATLLVTSSATVASAVLAMKLGAVDVIEKPVTATALEDGLALAFERLAEGIEASAAAQDARARIDSLSRREREVMAHLFDGHANKETARELGISPRTVEIHRAAAMRKLGVDHLAKAMRLALVAGWEAHRAGRSGWDATSPARKGETRPYLIRGADSL